MGRTSDNTSDNDVSRSEGYVVKDEDVPWSLVVTWTCPFEWPEPS